MTTEGHRLVCLGLVASALAGCRPAALPVYETFAPPPVRYAPASGTDNAFDGYALAAEGAEQAAQREISRVSFTPAQRQQLLKRLAPELRQVVEASSKPCRFEFTPRNPFEVMPYVRGWRLIGNCFCWEIEGSVASGDLATAVSDTIFATRFGFDLTGGGGVECANGLRIVDDARRAILPCLDRLTAKQLGTLESGLAAALARKPPMTQTIENERLDTLQTLQSLEDHYRAGTLSQFESAYGADVREPIEYLRNLGPTDPKRGEFLRSLADYSSSFDAYVLKVAAMPTVARAKISEPEVPSGHAWHRLAKYVARAPLPLLEIDDVTVARTRLFIIVAELQRDRKLGQPIPSSLAGFSKPLSTDPFTGAPFIYHSNVDDYQVYSVGRDGLDNAGQTDSAFLQPDLTLESR